MGQGSRHHPIVHRVDSDRGGLTEPQGAPARARTQARAPAVIPTEGPRSGGDREQRAGLTVAGPPDGRERSDEGVGNQTQGYLHKVALTGPPFHTWVGRQKVPIVARIPYVPVRNA